MLGARNVNEQESWLGQQRPPAKPAGEEAKMEKSKATMRSFFSA